MSAVVVVASALSVLLGAQLLLRPPARRFRDRRSHRVPVPRRVVVLVLAAMGAVALATLAGPAALALGVGLVGFTRVARRRRLARKRLAAIDEALPHAIELLVITVRAGLSPIDAVRAIGAVVDAPVRDGFDEVVLRLERGHRLADALDGLPHVLGPGALAVADGIASADRYGTPLAPVLDRLATEAREARRRAAEARARTLPVRLSFPLVCCTLPSFVLMAIVPALLGTVSSLRGTTP